MKIELWSVGKPHELYAKTGIEDFSKRINNYYPASWHIINPPKNAGSLSEANLKKAEATAILQQLDPSDYLVLLDERGQTFSSPKLASFMQQRANESTRKIVFLIGGAFGVDETVFTRANFCWSLSQLVFPHMLVRLILAEQVYRACTILRNEKYHHN
jgi:23S rRNA (pseudouridine1915-N3)-methyltransferase